MITTTILGHDGHEVSFIKFTTLHEDKFSRKKYSQKEEGVLSAGMGDSSACRLQAFQIH